jgi:hypothetical protein
MSNFVKLLPQAFGKLTMRDALAAGGWKVLIDGNLA